METLEIKINVTPKEIAELVLEIQNRLYEGKQVTNCLSERKEWLEKTFDEKGNPKYSQY